MSTDPPSSTVLWSCSHRFLITWPVTAKTLHVTEQVTSAVTNVTRILEEPSDYLDQRAG